MIFLTGQHHGQEVVLATPSATLRPTQGQSLHQHVVGDTALACFGRIPWIGRQGVRRAQQQQSDNGNDDGNDGDSDGSIANGRDGSNDGNNNNKGDVDGDGGGNNDYDNDDVNDKNDDNAMATMTMEQQQSDGDGLMSTVLPIRGNNQLMSTVW